jgi:hypothetical protein
LIEAKSRRECNTVDSFSSLLGVKIGRVFGSVVEATTVRLGNEGMMFVGIMGALVRAGTS